ncbi:NACHT domain-containing protein [Nonomuraea rubra]
MRQIITYQDAVALLGGPAGVSSLLDKASSLVLFGTGGIDLFDARAEAVRLGDAFLRGLRDKVKGLSRYDSTQRLAAAHSVIVVTAFLDALGEMDVLRELTPDEQRRITGADGFGRHLIEYATPMPTPALPFEELLDELAIDYQGRARTLVHFLSGLRCWDIWDETARARLGTELPARAVRRYQELFRRLVADFPEVACWAGQVEHQATRAELGRLAHGLAGIQEQLARIPSTRSPSDRLAVLIRSNAAALKRPIVSAPRTPSGMAIPSLDQGYIDPAYRVLPARQHQITSEETWSRLPRRRDLDTFLTGHLTLPQATASPLLVLGQPGAGKSVLTRMLAARLPAAEFLPLRVELRGVPADGDVLAQIEHGIRAALDEQLSWPEFVHAAEGALPVVMLDGFDELLQATGVNQTDYLERVARFQRDQAEKGRALAVVVTSRTAVADRARLPADSFVIRLEPFDDDQIRRWAGTWNRGNGAYLRERGLEPLPVDKVLAVRQLAEQPLLLLMLALYDADANALRNMPEDLHEAELYERLLHDFAVREIGRTRPHLTDADLERAVEDELLRLSITAFAMFNRGMQWIAEPDLDADLRALLPQEGHQPQGLRRALSRAESVIGGFFFVHTTQALRDDERLKTYEFLHATFGEYLVARLVVRELADLAGELAYAGSSRRRFARPDDAYLHALLSFACLAVRAPTVDFLRHGLTCDVPADRRALLTSHLCELFSESLLARPGSSYEAYQPVRAELTARHAAYSANLLLLAVLSADEPIEGARLFRVREPEQANERWRRIARLWHSQLTRAEWDALIHTLHVRHFLRDTTRSMRVAFDRDPVFALRDLVFFTWPGGSGAVPEQDLFATSKAASWMREISFRDDTSLGHLFVDLLPYYREIDERLDAHPGSPVADLLAILLGESPDPELYRRAVFEGPSDRYVLRLLRQLAVDAHAMPAADVLDILRTATARGIDPVHLEPVQQALVSGQPHDQPGLRPVLDPELPAVGPDDVAGDRQP